MSRLQHCPHRCRNQRNFPDLLTTVDVTGGIGIDLKNWIKKVDMNGHVLEKDGEPVLEEVYSSRQESTVITINTKEKKLYHDGQKPVDISSSFTPQKLEFMKAGGSYAIVFEKNSNFLPKPIRYRTTICFCYS